MLTIGTSAHAASHPPLLWLSEETDVVRLPISAEGTAICKHLTGIDGKVIWKADSARSHRVRSRLSLFAHPFLGHRAPGMKWWSLQQDSAFSTRLMLHNWPGGPVWTTKLAEPSGHCLPAGVWDRNNQQLFLAGARTVIEGKDFQPGAGRVLVQELAD